MQRQHPPMAHIFRPLDQACGQAVQELEAICFSQPWSGQQWDSAFKNPAFHAWGLWQEDLDAYLSSFCLADEMEIINFAVRPQCRRQGLGKTLLAKVLQEAGKMGIQSVWLEVRESNFAAAALYAQAGFRPCGIRKNYYPGTGENAVLHALSLREKL